LPGRKKAITIWQKKRILWCNYVTAEVIAKVDDQFRNGAAAANVPLFLLARLRPAANVPLFLSARLRSIWHALLRTKTDMTDFTDKTDTPPPMGRGRQTCRCAGRGVQTASVCLQTCNHPLSVIVC